MRTIATMASPAARAILTGALGVTLTAALSTALTGCGLTGADHPQPAAAAKAHTSAAPPAAVVPATVPDSPKLRTAVHITACEALPDRTGWQASGTVANTSSKPADYHITIFFTTAKATDVGYADTKVTAAPGATAKWTASKKFAVPSDLTCVLRAVG